MAELPIEEVRRQLKDMGIEGMSFEAAGKLLRKLAEKQHVLNAIKTASRDGRLDAFTVDAVIDYAEAEFAEAINEEPNHA